MPGKLKHEAFEVLRSGSQPNSLDSTIEVIEIMLKDASTFSELYTL